MGIRRVYIVIMKICILTPRFPLPENGGDLLRICNVSRYLKSQGHELVLVSYTETEPDMEAAREIFDKIYTARRSMWDSALYSALFMLRGRPIQCGYYYSRRYGRLFHDVVQREKPDLYVSHLIRMLSFVEREDVVKHTIVEMTDALTRTYYLASGAKGSLLKRVMYSIEKHFIGRYELGVARRYPKVVLVSQTDIDFLKKGLKGEAASLALHTNGVAMPETTGDGYDSCKICFLGNMVSLQNQDAAIYFTNEVFPKIVQERPDARFYIVGNNPPQEIVRLGNGKNIFVTGYVENLNAFISDACVAVAPVRIAAGIQNKVLVSMSNAVPVVLTPLIATPIPELKDGTNCFISKDADEFARRCVTLMNDRQKRMEMGRQGREMVKQSYAWARKLKGYEEL